MLSRRLLFLGLAVIVAFAPLPLGSNRDWSWSPLAALIGTLMIAQAIVGLRSNVNFYALLSALRVSAALVAVVVLWGFAQAFAWTPASWENPIRIASAPYLPLPTDHSVTLDREQSLTGLMRLLSYVGVFVLAAVLSRRVRDARRLCGVLVCSAVAYTLYSMLATLANQMTIATGLSVPVPLEGYFSGPFINRNNYATYASVAALTALALALGTIRIRGFALEKETVTVRWRRRLGTLSGEGGLWFVATAILIMGVLLSGSRAGAASLAIGLVFMLVLNTRSFNRWTICVATFLGAAALVLFLPAGNTLLTRSISLIEEGEVGREYLFTLTINAISLRPLLGWGMNSFQSLYGVFQPIALTHTFDKSHNTYLELAFDLGTPIAAALIVAVLWIVIRCLRGASERHRDREYATLGFCASVTVGIHALFDFSLQIPGVAVVFAALLGTAWSQSWSSRRLIVS